MTSPLESPPPPPQSPPTPPPSASTPAPGASAAGSALSLTRGSLVGLALVVLVHAALVVSTWGPTYWDFGDGNYLYISKRLTEGVTLYRDILAPQPPIHLLTGAALWQIGDTLLGPGRQYLAFRAFSLALRSLTAVVLFLLAWEVFRRDDATRRALGRLGPSGAALAAAAVWLFLPIGFWWQLGYQSEPIEILFLLLAVWGVWRLTPNSLAAAGVASALAAHCNMTAAPYFVCNAVFLACRQPRALVRYLPTFLGVYFGIAFAADFATGGHFWDNVIFNQTGTFPRNDILALSHGLGYGLADYVYDKVVRMGEKILGLQGMLLLLAGVGLGIWTRHRDGETVVAAGGGNARRETPETPDLADETAAAPPAVSLAEARAASIRLMRHRREYIAWTAIGHWLSLGFVAKGGTMDYIFTIGEPFVALFAGLALTWLWVRLGPARGWRTLRFSDTSAFVRLFAVGFVVFLTFYAPAGYIRSCVAGLACELPADRVGGVFRLVEHYSEPGDWLLAPPFYAVMTGRNVAGEYSENYIWSIKHMNERADGEVGPGVLKARELAWMLGRHEIPFVILDMAQTARLPEIARAIEARYHQVLPDIYHTYNTQLTFWVPNTRAIDHPPDWRSDGR